MDVGHIGDLVLAAHGQRDLVENLPLIADFHGKAAVITTTILVPPNLLKPSGQPLHALPELTTGKIFGIQVRVHIHSYFRMPYNRNISKA